MKKRLLTDDQVAELRRLWAGWATPLGLARRFGITVQEVWERCEPGLISDKQRAWLKAKRQKAQAQARINAERDRARTTRALVVADRRAEIRRLWGEGCLGWELAEWFGLAKSTISGIVAGMPSRRRYGDPEDVSWPHPRRRAPSASRDRSPSPSYERVGPPSPADVLGEQRPARGSANGRAKLSEADVDRLRALRAGGWTYPALAREFNISRSNVYYILSGKTWSQAPARPPAIEGESS